MRIIIAGDTHGNAGAIEQKAREAKWFGAAHIFVVGDFGLWPGLDGVRYLDDVSAIAREYDVLVTALPGNHEDHPQWDKWFEIAPLTDQKFAIVRHNVRLTRKVHPFKMGGKRFFVCGGAVSIDKQWRTPGKSWWPNEEFSEADLASVKKYQGKPIDYLLTHDCSDFTPFRNRLKPDPDSQANRRRIDEAIRALRPRYHFHGHMHTRYDWRNSITHGRAPFSDEWDGPVTHTYGLECDYDTHSAVVLDTGAQKDAKDSVTWLNFES